jgi:hypothetical protein
MTVEVLRARTEKWPLSPNTPENVAAHLARSRQIFVDGYYTYENFIDAATRSLQAVEVALRVRMDAGTKVSFAQMIDRAKAEGLVDDEAHDVLHTGPQTPKQPDSHHYVGRLQPSDSGRGHCNVPRAGS